MYLYLSWIDWPHFSTFSSEKNSSIPWDSILREARQGIGKQRSKCGQKSLYWNLCFSGCQVKNVSSSIVKISCCGIKPFYTRSFDLYKENDHHAVHWRTLYWRVASSCGALSHNGFEPSLESGKRGGNHNHTQFMKEAKSEKNKFENSENIWVDSKVSGFNHFGATGGNSNSSGQHYWPCTGCD